MKIAIGNDHSSVDMKNEIVRYLVSKGHDLVNVGTDSKESVDYPGYGLAISKMVVEKKVDLAIGICGTGIGISLSCNKVKGIRACVCSEPYSAKLSRQHNDANVLCFGSRVVGVELAKMIVDSFIESKFEGDRHARRVNMIMEIEKNQDLENDVILNCECGGKNEK